MMNMKLLAVLTPPSIYHGCSTRKTLWGEMFTLGEFTPASMKNRGCRNIKKHIKIKNSDEYITLEISLNFGSLDKMKITSPEPKYDLGRPGKGLITSLGLKPNVSSKKYKRQGIPLIMSV